MSWVEKPTILSYISKEQNYIFIDESGDIKDLKTIIKKVFVVEKDMTMEIEMIF